MHLEGQDWSAALPLLNTAVLLAPSPSPTLSFALYNRATVLLKLGEGGLALRDATLAGIKGSWPEGKLWQLYRLQAKCQGALGEGAEEAKCLHRALSALERGNFSEEERSREKLEIQEQLAFIIRKNYYEAKRHNVKREEALKVASAHKMYPSLSSCLSVQFSQAKGRHVVVRGRAVQAGEVLGVEDPLVHCLLREQMTRRCSYCLAFTLAPLPCASCRQVK